MKALVGSTLLLMVSCTSSYHGSVVGKEVRKYRDHHEYLLEKESEYIIVLENLMVYPEDPFLVAEKEALEVELLTAKEESKLFWDAKERAIANWKKNLYKIQTEQLFADSMTTQARDRLNTQLKKNGLYLKKME